MRVLIIEDEKGMAELLKKGLEEENHRVALAFDGLEGLELARVYEFDAIVLDLMLPKVDGFEVARRLRHSGNQTPILILTARDAVPDIVKGLDLGADDYLTKPFSFEEFLARLRTVARRGSAPRPTRLQVADLTLDPASHQAIRGRPSATKRENPSCEPRQAPCSSLPSRTTVPGREALRERRGSK